MNFRVAKLWLGTAGCFAVFGDLAVDLSDNAARAFAVEAIVVPVQGRDDSLFHCDDEGIQRNRELFGFVSFVVMVVELKIKRR